MEDTLSLRPLPQGRDQSFHDIKMTLIYTDLASILLMSLSLLRSKTDVNLERFQEIFMPFVSLFPPLWKSPSSATDITVFLVEQVRR